MAAWAEGASVLEYIFDTIPNKHNEWLASEKPPAVNAMSKLILVWEAMEAVGLDTIVGKGHLSYDKAYERLHPPAQGGGEGISGPTSTPPDPMP